MDIVDADPDARHIGRPPREVPESVTRLAHAAWRKRDAVAVPVPDGTTAEELDTFRLDIRAAGKRIGRYVYVKITGITDDGTPLIIDKREGKDRWPDVKMLVIRVYSTKTGSLRQ